MSDSKGSALRQMDETETNKMAGKCILDHLVRLVPSGAGTPLFSCSCGQSFPVSEGIVSTHLRWVIELRAEEIGAVPHPSWGGFAKPEADASGASPEHREYAKGLLASIERGGGVLQGRDIPVAIYALREFAGSTDRGFFGGDVRMAQAIGLISDLVSLLKGAGPDVHGPQDLVESWPKLMARADAFLQHGDEEFREDSDVEDRPLTDDDWTTVQELINAIGCLEGVGDRVIAYLHGRGFDDPQEAIDSLREKAF